MNARRMKVIIALWILALVSAESTEDAEEPVSSSDVALLRNVLSSVPRTQTWSHVLYPTHVSFNRLREMARWLNRYPNWQHFNHNYIFSLINGKNGYSQFYYRPTARPTERPTTRPVVAPQWLHTVRPSNKAEFDIRPLPFSSWYSLWKEEDVGKCGISDVETDLKTSRIVGGNVAKPGAWPWMASLLLQPVGQHWCAGVVIAPQWILTSPHCFEVFDGKFRDPRLWTVRLGKYNTSLGYFEEGIEQDFTISRFIRHPDFSIHNMYQEILQMQLKVPTNDIALIKLDRPATFTKWVKPLCLPHNDEIPRAGRTCVISGWGQTETSGYPGVPNEASIPLYSNRQCKQFPGYADLLTPNNICAGRKEGEVDACNGDSGGPLQCKFRNRWVISGITSYGDAGGRDCAQPLRPGVYTRINPFVEWIHREIYQDYVDNFSQE